MCQLQKTIFIVDLNILYCYHYIRTKRRDSEMEIKPGKYYKTRDGRRALCTAIIPEDDEFNVMAVCVTMEDREPYTVGLNGMVVEDIGIEYKDDLIEKLPDLRIIESWRAYDATGVITIPSDSEDIIKESYKEKDGYKHARFRHTFEDNKLVRVDLIHE